MPTTISERRRGPGTTAGPGENNSPRETDTYFGVVSWLTALGVAIAVALAAAYPTMTDIMWLFSQVP